MKRLFAIGLLCLLAGCSNNSADPDKDPGGHFGVSEVNVDGRDVTCITFVNGYAGGVSCDW